MDTKICDTPITGDFVAKHMKDALGPHAILRLVEGERIAVGQGFASNILKLKLTWEPSDENDLPKTVIVKAPAVESIHSLMETIAGTGDESEKMKATMAQMIPIIHNVECDLYHMFGKSPPIKMPKFYVALKVTDDEPGMIVLEDLSPRAAIAPFLIDGMTYPQILEAVTALARLHGWSLKTSIDWRSKMPGIKDREQMMRGVLYAAASGLQTAKEKYPTEFGSIDIEKLLPFVTYEYFENIMNEHKKFIEDVLMHGDYHSNNIMFEKNKDGDVNDRLVAVIDFQASMKGCPTFDIARLLCFSVSYKIRREHIKDILQCYYDEIKSIAGDKFTATFEQIQRLYDHQFALASILMVPWIPLLDKVMIKSDGDQRIKDEKKLLELAKANFDDALKVFKL